MASSNNTIAVSFFLMIAFLSAAMAKDLHVVWDANVDYDAWAAHTTIVQGDRLFFEYPVGDSVKIDVRQVSEEKFNSCEQDPADRGNDIGHRGIELSDSGTYYFINDFPGMCEVGWKLKINVLSAAAAGPPPPPDTPTAPFFPVTPTAPFFPVTPTPDAPFSPRTPPSPDVMPPRRSGGAPLSLSTLTFPFCLFIFSLFMH